MQLDMFSVNLLIRARCTFPPQHISAQQNISGSFTVEDKNTWSIGVRKYQYIMFCGVSILKNTVVIFK